MRKRLKNRIKSKQGFSLAEMLLVVVILLLVTAVVATGIPAVKSAYEKSVLASNAEVLLSTAMMSLRNELGTAKDITLNDKTITYYNETRGSRSKISLDSGSPATIMIQRYVKEGDLGLNSDPIRLVSKAASTADLYITYSAVAYSGGIITFTELRVDREAGGTLAGRDSFSVRVISE